MISWQLKYNLKVYCCFLPYWPLLYKEYGINAVSQCFPTWSRRLLVQRENRIPSEPVADPSNQIISIWPSSLQFTHSHHSPALYLLSFNVVTFKTVISRFCYQWACYLVGYRIYRQPLGKRRLNANNFSCYRGLPSAKKHFGIYERRIKTIVFRIGLASHIVR